jgi:hypothetical protein
MRRLRSARRQRTRPSSWDPDPGEPIGQPLAVLVA